MPVDVSAGVVASLVAALLARIANRSEGQVVLSKADGKDVVEQLQVNRSFGEKLIIRLTTSATQTAEARDRLAEAMATTGIPLDADSFDDELVAESALALAEAFLDQMVRTGDEVIDKLDVDEASRLGRLAADQVIAGARWSQLVGDRIDTTSASELLGVSRQALAKRQTSGSVLGLPGHGTTWYPIWQFDAEARAIRPEVRDIIGAFRDVVGDGVDPFLVAAWATRPQPEDLDGLAPAGWLAAGRDVDRLRVAARRAAESLGQ